MAKSKPASLPPLVFGSARSRIDLDLFQMQDRVNDITNWVSEFDTLDASSVFQHRTAVFSTNHVRVISVASSPTVMKVNDPDCTIAIPLLGDLDTRVGNRHFQYGAGRAMFTPPGKRHTEGGVKSVLLISITVKRLIESARVLLGESHITKLALETPRLLQTVHGNVDLLEIIKQACALVDQFQGDAELLKNFSPDEQIVRAIIMMLAPQCFFSYKALDEVAGPTGKRVLDRLCDYIVGNLDQPLNLTQLELVSGMSARLLQLEFKKRYATTPLQWVREQRLIRANTLLRNSHMTTSVSEVASNCGFDNLGDFARRYAAAFGELPSQALKRAQDKN